MYYTKYLLLVNVKGVVIRGSMWNIISCIV